MSYSESNAAGTASDGVGLTAACQKAARWVWTVGVLEMAAGGCATTCLGSLATQTKESLLEQAGPEFPAAQFELVYPWLAPTAILIFVLGFLPGLVYVLLGFGVKAGRMGQVTFALVLALTQVIVLVFLGLSHVAGAWIAADPCALTSGVVLFGSPIFLLAVTLQWLLRAQRLHRQIQHEETDPWAPNRGDTDV